MYIYIYIYIYIYHFISKMFGRTSRQCAALAWRGGKRMQPHNFFFFFRGLEVPFFSLLSPSHVDGPAYFLGAYKRRCRWDRTTWSLAQPPAVGI